LPLVSKGFGTVASPGSSVTRRLKVNERAGQRRERRALEVKELPKLLKAVRELPLHDAKLVRRGPNEGKLVVRVRPEVKQDLILLGKEPELIYRSLAFTGLRQNELASIRVCDLQLNGGQATIHAAAWQ